MIDKVNGGSTDDLINDPELKKEFDEALDKIAEIVGGIDLTKSGIKKDDAIVIRTAAQNVMVVYTPPTETILH